MYKLFYCFFKISANTNLSEMSGIKKKTFSLMKGHFSKLVNKTSLTLFLVSSTNTALFLGVPFFATLKYFYMFVFWHPISCLDYLEHSCAISCNKLLVFFFFY